MKKTLFLVVALSTALATCKYDAYNPDICFQENVLPIFVTKCAVSGCHDANEHEGGYDFSNYDGIMKGVKPNHPLQSEVYNVIKGSNPEMPVGEKLSSKEVNYIKIWIKMGAKNTSNCSSCDTSAYTYNARIKPLITTWCVGCHSGASAGGGYDFTTYSGIAGAASIGALDGSVNHTAGYSAMPKNAQKLTDCDVNAITKWVSVGFPEN